ncbi:MAG: class I SAM-dependent methyltransferase, partial [Alphaproteobacteria bacterium]|nr:class I SAM-dependent methyltransferase [Alphaproteobacteria bacterium]
YDALNPSGKDHQFYLKIAADIARLEGRDIHILDIGCGTGQLAKLLARDGHQVVGVDPAEAMLDLAKKSTIDGTTEFVLGEIADIPLDFKFDLVVMTGHGFQQFLTDAEVKNFFLHVQQRLKEGAAFVFDSRNPISKAWESWSPGNTARFLTHPDYGEVTVSHMFKSIAGNVVDYETSYFFEDNSLEIDRNKLRFSSYEEIHNLLSGSGFRHVEVYGDWQGASFRPDHSEMIFKAR